MKKKNKSWLAVLGVIMLASIFFCGCENPEGEKLEGAYLTEVECAYLADEESIDVVREAFDEVGIKKESQDVFFDHVEQFARTCAEVLPKGFHKTALADFPIYDPYEMQDEWNHTYPDFLGYNCRITSFGLMEDFIEINPNGEKRIDSLVMDLLALEEDSSMLLTDQSKDCFEVLFSTIPTVDSTEVLDHVKVIQEDWQKRGISFADKDNLSMISVFFHDKWEDGVNELMIGHVGVLMERENGSLLFVEKLAFQEPYQASIFSSRVELNDYLMSKYDLSNIGETARPFILENNKLLEGYRRNPNVSNIEDEGGEILEENDTEEDNLDAQVPESQESDESQVKEMIGTLEEIKDHMFIITEESGISYAMSYETKPKGLDTVSAGDVVLVQYTGVLSEVDPFTGEIIKVEKK